MPYSGQINFNHLEAATKGHITGCRVFLQEIGATGRAGSRLIEMQGFSNVSISRGISTKGKASITFSNIDDRVFQGGAGDQTNRTYSPINRTLTRKAISDALRKSLPYVKEINPLRRDGGADRAFQGAAPIGNRINEYLDFVYNFTGKQGVKLSENTPLIRAGTRFVDLLTLGLMQRVFIDIIGQDGLTYAGFSGVVSGINDDYVPGQVPTVTLTCSDYWRLFEVAEILVKQGPGVADPAQNSPDIRDTIIFDIQNRLGLSNDNHRASPFDSRPGQLILLDIMRITQDALCFIPNLQLRSDVSAIVGAINVLTQSAFDVTLAASPLMVSPEIKSIDIVQDANFVETRREFFIDDGFWTLPDEKNFTPSYEGHTNLRRVSPGVTFERAINTDGTEKVDERGQKTDRLLYVDPKRKLGQGIRDGDLIGTVTGTILVDRFILTGTQAIIYQQLVKSILGPWQVQYATGLSILKKLTDATFYDLYFTGNGDLVYQIPRYNNFPGEYNAVFSDTSRKLSTADQTSKATTVDAKANPEDGGDPKRLEELEAIVNQPPTADMSTYFARLSRIGELEKTGKISVSEAHKARLKVKSQDRVRQGLGAIPEAEGPLTDPVKAEKAAEVAGSSNSTTQTNQDILEIATDYQGLANSGLYDYSPDPRYPIKYHGFNYVISDLGLRRWSFQMSEEPLITVMRVPGGSDFLEKPGGSLEPAYLIGRTSIKDPAIRKLQQRFGVRPRTTQQILIPDLYTSFEGATILLNAFAAGLLQQVNGLGDGGSLTLSSRPDIELGHNVLMAERQKLYYVTSLAWTWAVGKDSSTTLNLAYGHDLAEELPNPWALVNLADLLTPGGTLPNAVPSQGTANSGDTQNRTRVSPGNSATWPGYVWPVPTLSYRGDAKYSNAKISSGYGQRADAFHYGADIMFARRDKEPNTSNNGSTNHYMPNGTPILAIGPGVIMAVGFTAPFGWSCQIDHRIVKDIGHVFSFYQHLTYYNAVPFNGDPKNGQSAGTVNMKPFVTKGQEVLPGAVLGFGGRAPQRFNKTTNMWVPDPNGLVHLHFELWVVPEGQTFDRAKHAVDTQYYLGLWSRVVNDVNLDGSEYQTNTSSKAPPPTGSYE